MTRGRPDPEASEAGASLLGRPWFLLAVSTLIVNDHWLKATYPGSVTGKVSDFAGPVVVATLLAVLFGRAPAVLFTAIGFVALKTAPGVAEAAEPLLGGVTRRDPTDLVGLVTLAPLWWRLDPTRRRPPAAVDCTEAREIELRAPAPPGSVPGAATSSAHPGTVAWIRRCVVPVGGAALSMLALTATSKPAVTEVTSLRLSGSTVVAELADPDREDEPADLAVSTDGGLSWEQPDEDAASGLDRSGEPAQEEACRSDGHCFAARGGTIQEKAPGGGWSTAFHLSDGQRELLDYRRSDGGADPDEMFESVLVASREEGETVVVSARDQGVVVLDEGGRWQRVSVLDAEATPTNGSMAPLDVATVVLLASLPVALLAAAVRAVKRGGGSWATAGSIVGALLVASAVWTIGIGAWALGTFTVQNPVVLAIVIAAVACAVVLLPLAFVRRAIPRPADVSS